MHVDAAYGGFAVVTERGKRLLRGIERADSISLDAHKWFFQPYEVACLVAKDAGKLEQAFAIGHDVLQDTIWGANHPNFADRGLQLSRTAKALKIWMSVQTFAYYGISQYRLRLLLGAVDARLQRDDYHKGEPVKTIEYDTLQVERVLPISWQEHWPVEASDPGEKIVLEQERSDHVHRIGNLTLVTERLNPAMSNAPWKEEVPGTEETLTFASERAIVSGGRLERASDPNAWRVAGQGGFTHLAGAQLRYVGVMPPDSSVPL